MTRDTIKGAVHVMTDHVRRSLARKRRRERPSVDHHRDRRTEARYHAVDIERVVSRYVRVTLSRQRTIPTRVQ